MTGAELKTMMEACGLPTLWLFDNSPRPLSDKSTVRHWMRGHSKVPADVAAMISEIDSRLTAKAAEIVADGLKNDEPVNLVRFRLDADMWASNSGMEPLPTAAHAAMLSRARLALEAKNIEVNIAFDT